MYTGSNYGIPDEDGFKPHCMKKYLMGRDLRLDHNAYIIPSCKFKINERHIPKYEIFDFEIDGLLRILYL